MPTFAHVHSLELEIFAVSFPLIARHHKYNVQFLEALLSPFHQVYMSEQSCFPQERISLEEQRPSTVHTWLLDFSFRIFPASSIFWINFLLFFFYNELFFSLAFPFLFRSHHCWILETPESILRNVFDCFVLTRAIWKAYQERTCYGDISRSFPELMQYFSS